MIKSKGKSSVSEFFMWINTMEINFLEIIFICIIKNSTNIYLNKVVATPFVVPHDEMRINVDCV